MSYDIPTTDLSLLFDAIRSLARIKDPKTLHNTKATVPFEALVAIAVKVDIYCKERELHPSMLLDHLTELSKAKPPSPRGNNDWKRYNVSPALEDGIFDEDEADFLKEIDPENVRNAIEDDIHKFEDWMKVWNPDGTHVDVELGIMVSAEARMRWDMRKHAEFLLAVVEYRKANNYPSAAFEDAVPALIERLRPYHEGLDLDSFFQQHAALAQQKLKAMEQGEELEFGGPGIPRAEFERRQQESQE